MFCSLWLTNTKRRLQILQGVYFDWPLIATWSNVYVHKFSRTCLSMLQARKLFRFGKIGIVMAIFLTKAGISDIIAVNFLVQQPTIDHSSIEAP